MSSARLREVALERIRALMESHGITPAEVAPEKAPRLYQKHGMNGTREHTAWAQAKSRCANPKDKNFSQYGGRGIAMAPEWAHSFERFMADMGPRPDGAILKRRDVNAGYCRENCHWAPRSEQNRGKRPGGIEPRVLVEIDGVKKPLKAWAREKGVTYQVVYHRLKRGIPASEAFAPVAPKPLGLAQGRAAARKKCAVQLDLLAGA